MEKLIEKLRLLEVKAHDSVMVGLRGPLVPGFLDVGLQGLVLKLPAGEDPRADGVGDEAVRAPLDEGVVPVELPGAGAEAGLRSVQG